jgi:hypothetical protein
MGMLKRMQDMKDMVNAAPGMVAQGQQMAAQAQEMAAAQQAAAQAQLAQYQQAQFGGVPAAPPAGAATGPELDPIAGVSLEQFAAVSKGVAAYNYDASKLVDVAVSQGIDPASWESASQGWNERIKANPAVATQFNQLYRQS